MNSTESDLDNAYFHSRNFVIISSLNIIVNSLIASIMWTFRSTLLKTHSNKFLLNLLVSNATASVVKISYSIYMLLKLDNNSTFKEFFSNNLVFIFFINACCLLSIDSLVLVTLDRFVAIKYPFFYQDKLRSRRIYGIIFLAWLLALVYFLLLIIVEQVCSEKTALDFSQYCFIVTVLIGFLCLIISNGVVFYEANKHLAAIAKLSPDGKQNKTTKLQNRQCRLFRINVGLVLVFVVFWTPALVDSFRDVLGCEWNLDFTIGTFYMVHIYYIVNACIYTALSRDVKAKVKHSFRKRFLNESIVMTNTSSLD